MELRGTQILDTFAEAFDMRYVQLLLTAHDDYWLEAAIREFTGYSSSVIACDAETAVESYLEPTDTPDGRCGASLLAFGFSKKSLAQAIPNRTGQCLMTCPTTAVFDGLHESEEHIPLGKHIRYFGDGFQKSKKLFDRRYWRIPVMDGEFLCEDEFGTTKGIGGGNLLICGRSQAETLIATRQAVRAISDLRDVILHFPSGFVRSGSKVGSKYPDLKASTNDKWCPTLTAQTETALRTNERAVYEIVIDGLTEAAVAQAMQVGLDAAAGSDGILRISAGNYGGKLGPHHFHLHRLSASQR